ncbi:hypothetical protein [Namhaeicola litoreus]|uniref:Erythromycin esterase family protein n=1 Tax=Namhaeicola litoreus TaxID=1052145 RepID=A0ABW3Y4C7_9FLAO
MKILKILHVALLLCCWSQYLLAQDSLLLDVIYKNHKIFKLENKQFSGEGWDFIKEKVITRRNILIGEDHFSNEIPLFVKSLSDVTSFDNFYIEVDPYSTRIIEKSLTEYTEEQRQAFNNKYGELFSFYSFQPEYDLLHHLSNLGTKILGSDQVVMFADQLIFQDMITTTTNAKAKIIYTKIMEQSKLYLEKFHKVTKNPMTMYFMTPNFGEDLAQLEQLDLSETENQIIADMKKSITIYKEQNHSLRIKLILNQLMKDYPIWKDSKNLFKYGANHMTRGESFLTVYDVGNMVANITKSNYQESFHMMIVGESGMTGSIFKSFPPNPVDTESGFYLSYLKPFFNITEGEEWYMFDLEPIRKMIERDKLKIDNINLIRAIKGYDILVIIPELTPAKLLGQQ